MGFNSAFKALKFPLTLIVLTWKIWCALNNVSKWQMKYNSTFNELYTSRTFFPNLQALALTMKRANWGGNTFTELCAPYLKAVHFPHHRHCLLTFCACKRRGRILGAFYGNDYIYSSLPFPRIKILKHSHF